MLGIAFKEWAGICNALAAGRQALILRKGGISEENGLFRPDHSQFWLYPTYFHEPEGTERPPEGKIILSHWAEVVAVHYVDQLETLLNLAGLHAWTEATVRQRFAYRTPGLYVLTVKVFHGNHYEMIESPEYAGCKTWVHLGEPLSTEGSVPVLKDEELLSATERIEAALKG